MTMTQFIHDAEFVPISVWIFLGGGALSFIFVIFTFTLYPLIYNLWIIPKIENKIGQKLIFKGLKYDFHPINLIIGKYVEIGWYIAKKWLSYKSFGDPNKIPTKRETALVRVNYPLEKFSKFEIIMSCISVFSWYYWVIVWFTICILGHFELLPTQNLN